MALEIPEKQLLRLNPADVRWYALQEGWQPVEGVKRPLILMNHPTDRLKQLLIPTAGSEQDVAFMMGEVVQRLAETEHRSPLAVWKDLTLPPADVLRLGVQSGTAESGTLPLDVGLSLVRSGHDLLRAAACSAHQPQAFFPRQSFSDAQDFLKRCRLGQTEQGSFVAAFLAPIPPKLEKNLFDGETEEFSDAPYERKVTLMLMQGLRTIRTTLEQGVPLEVSQTVIQGVSANLCEAITALEPGDERAIIHLAMRWSRTRPRVPRGIPDKVSFSASELPIIREIGHRLRESVKTPSERVEGKIITLQAEVGNLYKPVQGQVTIRTLIEGQSARVRFMLDETEYLKACDAHRDRKRVQVVGTLVRDGKAKLYNLHDVEDFQVLSDS